MSVDATELAALPVFDALSPKELERLAAGADRVEIGEPGVELTTEGDFGHSVFVVLEGSARVSIGAEAVRDLSPGDLFGEVAVLSSGRRTATVVSLTPDGARERLQARRLGDRGDERGLRSRAPSAARRAPLSRVLCRASG